MANFEVRGQFKTHRGDEYTTMGIVTAKNEESAKAQLDWVLANHHCLCIACLDKFENDYGTMILVSTRLDYSMCVK